MSQTPQRDVRFETLSGIPVKALYTPDDVKGSYDERLGTPGEYPRIRTSASSTSCARDRRASRRPSTCPR
jgi:hypothetical protein